MISENRSNSWEQTTLGGCGRWFSGGTPSKDRPDFWNGNVPWISAKSMNCIRLSDSEERITLLGSENGTRFARKGSILILVRGSMLHQRIPIGITTKDVTFNQDVKAIVPASNVLPEFLLYWLLSNESRLLDMVEFTGIGAGKLSTDLLYNLEVKLPSLPEQRAIAHILGTLDDKIELSRRMNETLGAMAHAIFKSWFVDFDPVRAKAEGQEPAGMDTETAGLFPDSFEERELGMVPKGWETKLLGQITCYINRGIQPKYIDNDGITVINQKCIRDHRIDWTKARRHDPNFRPVNGSRELQIGDLLMNSTGVGTLGRVAQILCLYERAIVDSHVTIVRADPKIITWNTLGLMLFTREAEIEDLGEGTTGQIELSRERLKSLKVLVPSLSAQKSFDKVTLPLRDLIISNEIQMQALADIRNVLLPTLLSGEVRVKVAGE